MASSPPENGDYCITYGFKFYWTTNHLTREQMRPLMFSYDVLATEALGVLEHLSLSSTSSAPREANISASAAVDIGGPENNIPAAERDYQDQEKEKGYQQQEDGDANNTNSNDKEGGKHPRHHRHSKKDLYTLLHKHRHDDGTLSALWDQVNTVPSWVDWAQIERGQRVFYRYALPFIISLTFQSLLGGMGSSRVSHTLSKTGGFSGRISRKRLLDTFQHVLDVTRDLDSIKPGGKGFVSSLRVRLLHASVRRRILLLAKENPSYYSVEENGIPINDLDSMATIIAFSATVIFLGFPRQGIFLRRDEIEDYLALWRWIGYVMGTPVDRGFFCTPERAKALMESLALYEINPSETSAALANNIIAGLQNQPPIYASRDFLCAQAHWLNGSELATALRVPRPPMYYFILVARQCLLFMVLCYIRRAIPYLDERNIKRMKRLLYQETMEQSDGVEASHGFKYLPRLGKETVMDGPLGKEEGGTRSGNISGRKGAAGRKVRKWRRDFGEREI